LHPYESKILFFLYTFQQVINKDAHGEQYPPIRGLLGTFKQWLIQGIANEVSALTMIVRLSAFLSFEHLVGHTNAAVCKRGVTCKGGITCDERMTLPSRPQGHLYHFGKLTRGDNIQCGAYGICWYMGHAIRDALPEEATGFMHTAFSIMPPRSIWTSDYQEYWRERFLGNRPEEEVWVSFCNRVNDGLEEVQSKGVNGNENSEGAGLEKWPDEE
jgi:hypothetical protein